MNQHKMSTGATIGFVLGVGLWVSPVLGQKIYWIEKYWSGTGLNQIRRANLDGSNAETLVTPDLANPADIALDPGAGKVYWTEEHQGRVRRSNLDGSDVETVVSQASGPAGGPEGIALDLAAGKVYWTVGTRMRRANLDGSNAEMISPVPSTINDVALDPTGGKMYFTGGTWANQTAPAAVSIRRANLDGSSEETIVTTGPGSNPRAITLDLMSGKIYWADGSLDTIYRANLDGSNWEAVLGAPSCDMTMGLALDLVAGKVLWTDCDDRVRRANLADGSQIETLVENPTSFPQAIVLDEGTGQIYWGGDKIQRAEQDGSNVVDILVNTTGLLHPYYLTYDPVGQHLYWMDWDTRTIYRANLDGLEVAPVIQLSGVPYGLAVDSAAGKIYWFEDAGIHRADLNGANVELLPSTGAWLPGEIALDVGASKVYWIGMDWPPTGVFKIRRANLDGSALEVLVTMPGSNYERFLALDLSHGKMYWSDPSSTGKLQRANLDGSEVEDSMPLGYDSPYGIALDPFSGHVYWAQVGTQPQQMNIRRANLDFSQAANVYSADPLNGLHVLRGMVLDVACERRLYGDVDPELGNNAVDVDDILLVLAGFMDPMGYSAADLYPCPPNGDGIIDVDDIQGILAAFVGNSSCPHLCR